LHSSSIGLSSTYVNADMKQTYRIGDHRWRNFSAKLVTTRCSQLTDRLLRLFLSTFGVLR
jgi:hypothetical protein